MSLFLGSQYKAHAEESGVDWAKMKYPVVFMKPTSSVIGPGDYIIIPGLDMGDQLDWECEMAMVIGKTCKDVSAADALDYVAGYTIANDVSARFWQKGAGADQWIIGKGFDTLCPLGPAFVTADEVPDPQALRIQTLVNGVSKQDSNTVDMIFDCRQIIEWLSTDTTLLPGTVILTGTPSGVGAARRPQEWLTHGDVVTIDIEGLGALSNPVVAKGRANL